MMVRVDTLHHIHMVDENDRLELLSFNPENTPGYEYLTNYIRDGTVVNVWTRSLPE